MQTTRQYAVVVCRVDEGVLLLLSCSTGGKKETCDTAIIASGSDVTLMCSRKCRMKCRILAHIPPFNPGAHDDADEQIPTELREGNGGQGGLCFKSRGLKLL